MNVNNIYIARSLCQGVSNRILSKPTGRGALCYGGRPVCFRIHVERCFSNLEAERHNLPARLAVVA